MLIPSRTFDPAKCWNLDFDGSNDLVDIGAFTAIHNLSALSFMCWVRPDIVSRNFQRVGFSKWNGWRDNLPAIDFHTGGPGVGATNGLFCRISTSAANSFGYTGSGLLAANTWVHIAFVFDGSLTGDANRLKIYTNGVERALTFAGTIPATTGAPAQNLTLAGLLPAAGYSGYSLDGRQTNVSFWNRALPQKEIQYWKNHYLTGREKGLIAYYPFLDRTGTTLKDWSNNKLDGTITGATWTKGS
jgi:hypothetical protein